MCFYMDVASIYIYIYLHIYIYRTMIIVTNYKKWDEANLGVCIRNI